MTFINEGNLYRLIIKSRKPEAERFEVWVCDEVLPSIRKTGGYAVPKATADEGLTGEVTILVDEYVYLLKQRADFAHLRHERAMEDQRLNVAVDLIAQGKMTRQEISSISGVSLPLVDQLIAVANEGGTAKRPRMRFGESYCSILS